VSVVLGWNIISSPNDAQFKAEQTGNSSRVIPTERKVSDHRPVVMTVGVW